MSWLQDLFSTQTANKGTTTGTTNTQNNAWDQLSGEGGAFQQWLQQFGQIPGSTAGISPFLPQAAQAQSQVPGNLTPAYAASSSIAGAGIDPNSIARFQSPYQQQVLDAGLANINRQNAFTNSDARAQAAKMGALTGSQGRTGLNNLAYGQDQTRNQFISNTLNQGFNAASGLAKDSAALQNQAAGTIGSLAGINTSANAALGAMGTNIQQGQLAGINNPFTLTQGMSSSLPAWLQGAGTNVQQAGTTSGTTTGIPSTGGVIAGLASLPFSFMASGGTVGMPGYNSGGSVGGAEHGHDDSHRRLVDKVTHAFHAFKDMHEARKNGGAMPPRYDAGGDVGLNSWEAGTTTTPASWYDNLNMKGGAAALGNFAKQDQDSMKANASALADSQKGLQASQQAMMSYIPKYHDGGDVEHHYAGGGGPDPAPDDQSPFQRWSPPLSPSLDEYARTPEEIGRLGMFRGAGHSDVPVRAWGEESPEERWAAGTTVQPAHLGGPPASADAPVKQPGIFDKIASYLPKFGMEGVWKGNQLTPSQRVAVALTGIGADNPMRSFGQNLMGLDKARLEQLHAAQTAAQLTGEYSGALTLAGKKNPAEIEALEAQGEKAKIRIAQEELRNKQDLELQIAMIRREQDIQDMLAFGVIKPDQAEAMRRSNQLQRTAPGKYRYDPRTGSLVPATE